MSDISLGFFGRRLCCFAGRWRSISFFDVGQIGQPEGFGGKVEMTNKDGTAAEATKPEFI